LKERNLLLTTLIVLSLLFPFSLKAVTLSSPPSTLHLKLPPPKNYTEAVKRIPDYVILNTILPPVIDRNKLKKQLFGSYATEVESILTKEKMKELTALITEKLRSKKFSLKELKAIILSKIKHKADNYQLPLPVLVGIIVSVIVPLLVFLVYLI
jgi:hypothetical protein